MINDLELIKNIEILRGKEIFLYGAAEYGCFIKNALLDMDMNIVAFFDSNPSLWNLTLHGKPVYPQYKVSESLGKDSAVLIITTIAGSNDVARMLSGGGLDSGRIFTLYGFFYGFYFQYRELLRKKPECRKKYDEYFRIFNEMNRLKSNYEQKNLPYQMMRRMFMSDQVPIIVNQPGKVGSNTISFSLDRKGIYQVRLHGLSFPFEYENNPTGNIFKDKLGEYPEVKMITAVRDPVDKDYGHFFQKISLREDMAWMAKGVVEKDFQTSWLNYLSVVSPFDYTGKRRLLQENIFCHIDYLGGKSPYGAYYGWYEEELKNQFGIDILQSDFDLGKGFAIMREGNIHLLIVRLDKLNALGNVIAEFVGASEFEILSINQHMDKDYAFVYSPFKREVRYPRSYIEQLYEGNPYTDHFFSEQEIREKKEDLLKQVDAGL